MRLPSIEVQPDQEITTSLQVFPDTIKVNGDQVTFEAKMSKGKASVQYKLSTVQEKKTWMKRQNWSKELLVQGNFLENETARNLHGFDQAWYQFSTNKIGTFRINEIKKIRRGNWRYFFKKNRARCIDWVDNHYSEKSSLYIQSLLLGYKSVSFQDIRSIYSTSGVLHLFTISGMHVYLFYGWFFYLFRKSQRTFSEFFLFFTVLIFFSVTIFGTTISVWRATLFYLIRLFFKEANIHLSTMDRFSIVLMLLLFIDPKSLLQVSGILSIGMSAILLFIENNPKQRFSKIRQSLEISLLVSPFLLYFFFEFPLLGGLLTSVMAPLFTSVFLPLCIGSIGLTVIGWQNNSLTFVLETLISFIEKGISYTKNFSFITGQPTLIFVVICLIVSLLCYQGKHRKYFFIPLVLLMVQNAFSLDTSVSFVDVGQGDSIVIQMPFKKDVYVVDTGGKLNFLKEDWQEREIRANAEFTLIPFLKGEGVRKIKGLVLTHGDVDHMGDTLALVEAIPVDTIYVGQGSLQNKNMKKLVKKLPRSIKIQEVKTGDQIGDNLRMNVLSPQHRGKGENEDSVVLSLAIKNTRFLLMGDLDQAGENQIIKHYPKLKTDILKLGHHGSKTSSGNSFIQATEPKQAIVSCGLNNSFHHPNQEVLDTLKQNKVQVFRTDRQGMIRYTWHFWDRYPKLFIQKSK
ncbi:MAG TPA: DNA internalization-related competence protein ComEC/Rec2 [Candidatus Tetragenococcus pullicola]|nr:DNA internalization-related competence protein ComEC/Rec2 [Candidatus Tetragenococcus pullicola]